MAIRYGVIGTGALGGFYGGMLAKSGYDVHFLFRSDYDFVKRNGLKVESIYGDFHLKNVNAYHSTQDMPTCDVVLVCLKTTENSHLTKLLKPIVHRKSVVILLQNGLGVEEDLAAEMPGTFVAGGLAFICSNKVGPGHVVHLDFGKLIIGSYNLADCEILHQVVSNFQMAGISTELSPDLRYARWQKLVWNVPFNGLAVVLNTTTDKLVGREETIGLARDLMLEIIHGANACGVALPETLAQQMIDMTIRMKPYAPSMKLDYDNRRRMEIGYIYSKSIEAARKAGFVMSKVEVLEKQLHFIQSQY